MNIRELIKKEKMYADAGKIYNTNEFIVSYITCILYCSTFSILLLVNFANLLLWLIYELKFSLF